MAPGRGGGPSQPEKVAYSRICNVEVRVYRQRKFWFRFFFSLAAGGRVWPLASERFFIRRPKFFGSLTRGAPGVARGPANGLHYSWTDSFGWVLVRGAGCGRWPGNVFLFADRNCLGPSRGGPGVVRGPANGVHYSGTDSFDSCGRGSSFCGALAPPALCISPHALLDAEPPI